MSPENESYECHPPNCDWCPNSIGVQSSGTRNDESVHPVSACLVEDEA